MLPTRLILRNGRVPNEPRDGLHAAVFRTIPRVLPRPMPRRGPALAAGASVAPALVTTDSPPAPLRVAVLLISRCHSVWLLNEQEQGNFEQFAVKCDRNSKCPRAQLEGRLAAVRASCGIGITTEGHRRAGEFVSLVLEEDDVSTAVEAEQCSVACSEVFLPLYQDCFVEAAFDAVPSSGVLAGLCLRSSGSLGSRCDCDTDGLQVQLSALQAQVDAIAAAAGSPAVIQRPPNVYPPPPPPPPSPPPPSPPPHAFDGHRESNACMCAVCADVPVGGDLCIPHDAARSCDCLQSAESQGNTQPFPASTQDPPCCREEWPAMASVTQQSDGATETWDQTEVVVRVHGRVSFSWVSARTLFVHRCRCIVTNCQLLRR